MRYFLYGITTLVLVALIAGGVFYYFEVAAGYERNLKLGLEAFQNPKRGTAVHYFEQALVARPNDSLARYQLARVAFVNGEFRSAAAYLNQAIKLSPSMPEAWYLLGLVRGFQRNYPMAAADFLKYLELKPGWAGYNDLAWIYLKQRDYKKAESTARNGLVEFSDNPWLYNQLAVSLLNQEKYQFALEYFRLALSGFEKLGPEEWAAAYPGNSSLDRQSGYQETLSAVRANIELTESKL